MNFIKKRKYININFNKNSKKYFTKTDLYGIISLSEFNGTLAKW